jgi:hypothetical protein
MVNTWRILDGHVEVARLVVTESDFPWLYARVEAADAFAAVRELFVDDLVASEQLDDDPAAADRAYEHIRRRLTLIDPEGRVVPEWLLHIDGNQAWWRWSDEPFESVG